MAAVFCVAAGIFLTIFLVVGVHELGHFTAARLLGIRVLKFSLGFGRKIISVTDRKKTEYRLSAIPLGGYVAMLDAEDATDAERHQVFDLQPYWKRFIVIAAGPVMNLLFALVIYWAIFIVGFTSLLPVTGDVPRNSIAASAGIQRDQIIVSADNIRVTSWMGVMIRILNHAGDKDTMDIVTKSRFSAHTKQHTLALAHWQLGSLKPDVLGSLGFLPWTPKTKTMTSIPKWMLHDNQLSPVPAFWRALQNTRDFTQLNFSMTAKILTGKMSIKSLGGPISIFGSAGSALRNGIISFMSFVAFLSIAVGVVNILPVPGLDGGHLCLITAETVCKRRFSPSIVDLYNRLGLVVIVLISIQAMVNDLLRLQ